MNQSSKYSRATKVRAIIATLVACVLMGVQASHVSAVTSLTGKEFGYWGNGNLLPEHEDHVSLTMLHPYNAEFWTRMNALGPTVKAIVAVEQYLTNDGCHLRPDWQTAWNAFSATITPYLSKIAAFDVAHEPETSGVKCFGAGWPNRQLLMSQVLETRSAIVKATPGWPAVKTYATYGPVEELVTGPLAQNIDWNGFDCYGPFENCFATGVSITQLTDAMAARLAPAQSIFLLPDASCFVYDFSQRKTHESELYVRGVQYWQLAMTHPRVKGMIGFIWEGPTCTNVAGNTLNDINDSAGLRGLYRNIGLNTLTGAVPTQSAFNVPGECVISAGATCNVNISWNTVSGPNVSLFARLVGDVNVATVALCPGATSCAVPAGVGDYIFELRETNNINSKLISAIRTKVRHPVAATGQITLVPSSCTRFTPIVGPATCPVYFGANVQNAPNASFFLAGSPAPLCSANKTSLCSFEANSLPPGTYSFTIQLRANLADPNSQLLEQRTFPVTIPPL